MDLVFLTRYFEAWLLKINGILPGFSLCKKCKRKISTSCWLSIQKDGVFCDECAPQRKESVKPELSQFLSWIRKNPPSTENDIPFSTEQLKTIQKTLQTIIIFHLDGEPRTMRYLKE